MLKNTTPKWGFALLWIGFVIYAFAFAPPQQPDTFDTILKLSTGQWSELNPAVVALFNLMGIWPMVYACLMLIEGATEQKLSAWPFVTASFAVGAFALLPYLALRQPHSADGAAVSTAVFEGKKTKLLSLVDSPWTGRAIALGSIVLLSYGLFNGDWSDFAQQWQSDQFIHVMSLDFCMLCAVVSPLVKSDMARRSMNNPALFWTAALVPLLGVAIYLAVRPPIHADANEDTDKASAIKGVTS